MNSLQIAQFSNKVFDQYDTNQSGFIERDELTQLLNALAKDMDSKLPTQQEIDYVLNYTDKNNDQKISKQEFQKLAELMVKALKKK